MQVCEIVICLNSETVTICLLCKTGFICRPKMLSCPDLIKKKRDGRELSNEEVQAFIQAVTDRTIQECQIGMGHIQLLYVKRSTVFYHVHFFKGAMLMAIWQKGMTASETQTLTRLMMTSGEVMSWPSEWAGRVVDKHSTGGVGDKVSLVLAPALAACNCKVNLPVQCFLPPSLKQQ